MTISDCGVGTIWMFRIEDIGGEMDRKSEKTEKKT